MNEGLNNVNILYDKQGWSILTEAPGFIFVILPAGRLIAYKYEWLLIQISEEYLLYSF